MTWQSKQGARRLTISGGQDIMKNKVKRLISIAVCAAMSTMLFACGGKTPAADTAPTEAASEQTTEASTEGAVTADELGNGQTNTLAVKGPTFSGMTNIVKENNDDGTYHYEDMTEDGITQIINLCTMNYQDDGQDPDAYAELFCCSQVDNDAKITGSWNDDKLSAALTYPVYRVNWTSGENEDSKYATGVVILTDWFTYFYGYKCPADYYEENESFYEEGLNSIELIDLGSSSDADVSDNKTVRASGGGLGTSSGKYDEEYAQLYIDQMELHLADGDADQFALVYIDDDEIPELVASSSEGSWEKDQIFIYTIYGGEMVLLASDIAPGMEGHSLGYFEGENIISHSGAVTGDRHEFYEIFDGSLESVLSLEWFEDAGNDYETVYYVDDEETTEKQYTKALQDFISEHGYMTVLGTDDMSVVSLNADNGYLETEVEMSIAYMTLSEIEEELDLL